MKIGILGGTGRMGRGLAGGFSRAGHQVLLGSRTPERARDVAVEIAEDTRGGSLMETASEAELVVLAVPFAEAEGMIRALEEWLADKIVVDITNPFGAVAPGQTSATEVHARAVPTARWVAAYKTTFWKTLDQPESPSGGRRDVLVCSDDQPAQRTVMGLIEETGFRAIDCGRLVNARTLDLMVPLMIEVDDRYRGGATSSWSFWIPS